jgi:hypothetical protein
MEAVQTTETSVNSHQSTDRCNPEDSHLHSQRCENLKLYSRFLMTFADSLAVLRLTESGKQQPMQSEDRVRQVQAPRNLDSVSNFNYYDRSSIA